MGLFVRQNISDSRSVYYTLQQDKRLIVVGLGNPEKQYYGTRHNFGFAAVDAIADHFGVGWVEKKDHRALMAEASDGGVRLQLIKPLTFMNNSGEAVQSVLNFYKLSASHVLVVHDELDIPLGDTRLKQGGSSAGHNGLKSIIKLIGEDFWRLRLGVGPKTPAEIDSADFVLGKFTPAQKKKVKQVLTDSTEQILDWAATQKQIIE